MVMVGNVCRPAESCTPIWPYQTLPDPVLAERIALAVLVWSAGALPTVTMASRANLPGEWWIWFGRTTHYQLLPSLRSGSAPAV